MGQMEVLERLYYLPNTKAVDIAIILNLSHQSVNTSLKRLIKHRYVERVCIKGRSFVYKLTTKGEEFAKRYYL